MYRHELCFVLRFGVRGEFDELARRLHAQESARGWSPPRFWHGTTGRVNQLVIEHEYEDAEAFRSQRSAFHADPGEVGEILASVAQLAVPGTAFEHELDSLDD
jgi:hypothetical protein